MRADRLPDLVNNNQTAKGKSSIEASVTVTFDLSDLVVDDVHQVTEVVIDEEPDITDLSPDEETDRQEESEEEKFRKAKIQAKSGVEWSVTRRLRVTSQGTYTSNYYINGVSCTLTELHEELEKLRIHPEGYNVVLQGDVTSIISMNSRERREIIDELAGVAAFDRKITQAKGTLDEVKEKEDSCRIVETELIAQRDRLSQDRAKAEKYQKLRTEYQEKQLWETVLSWRSLQAQQEKLSTQIQEGDRTKSEIQNQLALKSEIAQKQPNSNNLTPMLNPWEKNSF